MLYVEYAKYIVPVNNDLLMLKYIRGIKTDLLGLLACPGNA